MLRGGSWINDGRNLRSANRNANDPGNRNDNVGFRLARAQEGWMAMFDQTAILSPRPTSGQKPSGPRYELARQLIAEGIVEDISASTVRADSGRAPAETLAPSSVAAPQTPRDAIFYATVAELNDLYTRPLQAEEMVLSVDAKTSLQLRPRPSLTLPALPDHLPNRVEHEYERGRGAESLCCL